MAAVAAWIDDRPSPRELFGGFARWLPLTVFLGGLMIVLLLLFGVPFSAEAGRWIVGAAAVPAWVLRVATLDSQALRVRRGGPAFSLLAWWVGGVGVVASALAPTGELGVGLTLAVALLFLFLAHGRYALVVNE